MNLPKKLNVLFDGQTLRLPVGTLEMHTAGEPFFTFAPEWLANGFELSPLHWPRTPTPLPRNLEDGMSGVPGFIWDSLPDSFGQQVMEKRLAAAGIRSPTVMEMLGVIGHDGSGALVYEPVAEWVAEVAASIDEITLGRLGREAHKLFLGERVVASELLRQEGASLGGARPKMRLCIAPDGSWHGSVNPPPGSEHWIVKFDSERQPGESAVEYAYALMARAAGIGMPPARLLEARTEKGRIIANFAVRRFDRAGATGRIFYHSAAGLLNRPARSARGDYSELMGLAMALQTGVECREQIVRRCIFNFAASNRDDHFKNFGFIYDDTRRRWSLSPAFDLTYASPRLNWVRECGGRASRLLRSAAFSRGGIARLCAEGNLPSNAARRITGEVVEAVSRWGDFSEESGVRPSRRKEITRELEHELDRITGRGDDGRPPQ